MALTLFREKKKQGYLSFIFIIVIFAAGIWVARNYLVRPVPPPPEPPKKRTVEIDITTLRAPFLDELNRFIELPSLDGGAGRENPFLPY